MSPEQRQVLEKVELAIRRGAAIVSSINTPHPSSVLLQVAKEINNILLEHRDGQ